MPDVTPQAVPVELVAPQGTKVPESTPQGNTQPELQKDVPLTLETVRQLAREEATRIAQSQVAKGENRINQRIQEQFAALNLNKSALGLTDEQVTQAKQRIVTDAYTAEDVPQTSAPSTPDVDQAIQYLNAEIGNVFAEVGTTVTPADPEFKNLQATVDAAWNDPRGLTKILIAANQAANAKAQRVAALQENATARVVSGGGGQPSTGTPAGNSAAEMWSKAYGK